MIMERGLCAGLLRKSQLALQAHQNLALTI